MKNSVRQPKQERSIEKKNKIIQAGWQLFSEVGYHNTNTAEIAKRAGVSTGIVYGYFKDKRDIMISVLHRYIEETSRPIMDIVTEITPPFNFEQTVCKIVDKTIEMHQQNAHLHNALHALTATDTAVNGAFLQLEDHLTENLSQLLTECGVTTLYIKEKVHLAMNIVQSFAHEYVFDKHAYIDYQNMRTVVCDTITHLFDQ